MPSSTSSAGCTAELSSGENRQRSQEEKRLARERKVELKKEKAREKEERKQAQMEKQAEQRSSGKLSVLPNPNPLKNIPENLNNHTGFSVSEENTYEKLMEGVMSSLEGFSEAAVRATAKSLKIDMSTFISWYEEPESFFKNTLLVDVRSPIEFKRGHIPGAVNMPLFFNEERAAVGTCYKKRGHNPAVKLGLTYVIPKLATLLDDYKAQMRERPSSSEVGDVGDRQGVSTSSAGDTSAAGKTKILVVCMRGGLRSSSIAWYLHNEKMDVQVLEGGYKGFKQWARGLWTHPDDKEGTNTLPSPPKDKTKSKDNAKNTPAPLPPSPPPKNLVNQYKICVIGGRTGCGG